MTVTNTTLIPTQYIPNTPTALYTVTDGTAVVSAFVIGNSAGVDATVTLYIVESGQTVGGENMLSDAHRVRPNEEWRAVGLEGQVLTQGAAIYVESSLANTLTIRASGVLIT